MTAHSGRGLVCTYLGAAANTARLSGVGGGLRLFSCTQTQANVEGQSIRSENSAALLQFIINIIINIIANYFFHSSLLSRITFRVLCFVHATSSLATEDNWNFLLGLLHILHARLSDAVEPFWVLCHSL